MNTTQTKIPPRTLKTLVLFSLGGSFTLVVGILFTLIFEAYIFGNLEMETILYFLKLAMAFVIIGHVIPFAALLVHLASLAKKLRKVDAIPRVKFWAKVIQKIKQNISSVEERPQEVAEGIGE